MLDGVMEDREMPAAGGGRALSFASGVPGQIYGINSSRMASLGFRANSNKMLLVTAPAFLPNADEPYMDQKRDLRPPECSTNHQLPGPQHYSHTLYEAGILTFKTGGTLHYAGKLYYIYFI